MSLSVLIAIFVIGVLCIIIELFIPGGIVGAIGTIIVITSIVLAFNFFDKQTGYNFLIAGVAIVIPIVSIGYYVLQNTKLGDWMILKNNKQVDKIQKQKNVNENLKLVGKSGITVSRLRPSGIAKIEGKRIDVVTEGEFIDKDVEIKVIDVSGNRIVVDKISEDSV